MKTTARTDEHIPPKPRRNIRRRRHMSLFFPLTILMLLFLSVSASAELRMIDMGALLRAYGFNNGFDPLDVLNFNIESNVHTAAAAIEGAPDIDSALEFFTAARYGGVRLSGAGRRVVDRELPRGRAGDLKLGAAWLMKLCRDYTTQEAINRALAFISSRSGIPVSEFRRYFRSEVTRKLVEVARREFPAGTPLPQTIQPLIEYVSSFDGRGNLRVNDGELFRRLVRSAQSFFGRDTEKYVAYLKVIETISINLRTNVSLTVSGDRITLMSPLNNNGRIVA